MARPALSAAEEADARRLILDAALHLFARNGYAGVTTRALAETLGTSHTWPYRYFPSKRAIFEAAQVDAFERFAERLEMAAATARDPRVQLRLLGHAYLRFSIEESHAFQVMFATDLPIADLSVAHKPGSRSRRESARHSWKPLLDVVQALVRQRVLRGDPQLLAHLFWCEMHGIAALSLAGRLSLGMTAQELVDPFVTRFLAG